MGSLNTSLPVLDFALFQSPPSRLHFARSLVHALHTSGVAYLTNHSINPLLLDEAFHMTHELFSLPLETKSLAPHPASPLHHRGYSHPGQEKLSAYALAPTSPSTPATQTQPSDLRESYEIGSEHNTHEPNIWLPEPAFPGFRTWGNAFYAECHSLAMEILAAVAMGLEAGRTMNSAEAKGKKSPPGLVESHEDGYGCQLRLLHYPAVPRRELVEGRVVRMGAHCDWSTMTMLFQDDCGGLEVADPQNPDNFVPVAPIPGACVVTIGDLLMRWSNDKLKSTLHRVGLPPMDERPEKGGQMTRPRYSIPFFVSPHPDTTVECLASCVDGEHAAKYEPVTQMAYNRRKMNLQYSEDE